MCQLSTIEVTNAFPVDRGMKSVLDGPEEGMPRLISLREGTNAGSMEKRVLHECAQRGEYCFARSRGAQTYSFWSVDGYMSRCGDV